MRALLPSLAMALLMTSCTEPNPYLRSCGDGKVDPGEACDLGEGNGPSAACTEECRLPACGDGLVQEDEACDLGEENGDSAACTPLCQLARCGDGFVQADVEACDDGDLGNKASYDGLGGCSTQCTLLPTCGDSVVEAPYEDCDDGNTEDGDGCSHLCQKAVCGDGVLDAGEECDDGNMSNNDACLNVCIAATCGDGLLNEGVEECDDGNDVPDDGCDNACVRDRLVFVTEESFSPKSFDGLAGADLACVQIAVAHKLPNPASYKAWLSDAGKSPATRFHHSPGRYVLVTGDVIAASWDDLTDGSEEHTCD